MPSQPADAAPAWRGLVAGAILAAVCAVPVAALDTSARAALIVDHATGAVLLSKNAEVAMPPASMSKLMTLNMVFEALKDGRLKLTDSFRVSTDAWAMQGSKMFLREGESVTVEDLIRGVIVQSGNDACVVLAEGLAGSEAAFAQRMTIRARELGMMQSVFANSTGWPHPDHVMSSEDLVTLAKRLIDEFPEYYPYFAETEFTWDEITQQNRNPLLGIGLGADGLKTGHTEEAGYGLVGSAELEGRRVTFMVSGLDSSRDRLVETERLVTWAFREFTTRTLYEPDVQVASARVWLGAAATVALTAPEGIVAVIPWAQRGNIDARVEYDGPIEAPISKGQQIAELVLVIPDMGETRFALSAAEDVPAAGFLGRVAASARVLTGRAMAAALGGG